MRAALSLTAAVLTALAAPSGATAQGAEDDSCRVIEFSFTPAEDLQMFVWLEDTAGNYVDTVYITRLTGTYGLGNRPGMMEFNSAWAWPYGRRTTLFPVWAHRHGMQWPQLVFQNNDDSNLSHPLAHSSSEVFYCRPLKDGEAAWDTQTCASAFVFTDKGMFSETETSLYPPRSDVAYQSGTDDADVLQYDDMNPFDAVSRATPPGGEPYSLIWSIPDDLPDGDYVALIEVAKEFDQNAQFSYPAPTGIPWSEYGLPYRGQPSVVYRVPFSLGGGAELASTDRYAGWGDPEGLDGDVREPDPVMITENVDGSGASRLLLTVDDAEMYRFRVSTQPTDDAVNPATPLQFRAVDVTASAIAATFIAPGNDDMTGTAAGYEIRYLAGREITPDNFDQGIAAQAAIAPEEAGTLQAITFRDLAPNTNYYFGIRAYDGCLNKGGVAVLHVKTPRREAGEVDACFVATAAFGSLMQEDVERLRVFRDVALRTHVAGELLVQGYYTFGPAFARVIEPSDTLRRFTRQALRPVVDAASDLMATAPRRLLRRLVSR